MKHQLYKCGQGEEAFRGGLEAPVPTDWDSRQGHRSGSSCGRKGSQDEECKHRCVSHSCENIPER